MEPTMDDKLVEQVARATEGYGLTRIVLRNGSEVWRVTENHCVTIGGDHPTMGSALEAFRLAVTSASVAAARPAHFAEAAGIMDRLAKQYAGSAAKAAEGLTDYWSDREVDSAIADVCADAAKAILAAGEGAK